MSQLARYATVWWAAASDRPRIIAEVKQSAANLSGFLNVRFSADEMALIRHVGEEMGLERGAVVRSAIRAWLNSGNLSALGDPGSLTRHPNQIAG